jgi:hypothetical protein
MPRYTPRTSRNITRTATTMTVDRYLAIGSSGATRIGSTPMTLKPDEICVALRIEVPLSLFKRPALNAHISIPETASNRKVIDAKLEGQIVDAVKQVTGFDIRLVPVK